MVSVNRIGGCGNEMFQISAAYCYAIKHKTNYVIPFTNDNSHLGQEPVYFPNVEYGSVKKSDLPIYTEPSFHYSEIPYKLNLYLTGYYQSYLYHYGFKSELLKLFNIPINPKEGIIFLHYRLGDYKQFSKFHNIIDEPYLIQSLRHFATKGYRKFLVFSDEIDEAKERLNNSKFKHLQFEFSEGNSEIQDLSLMASCEGGIMSASSFSWWGAYLCTNENRTIIYPKNWFGESLSNHDIKDLCPKEWLAL